MKWWAKRLGGLAVASLSVELRASWTVIVVVSLLIVALIGFASWVLSCPSRTRRLARLIRAYRK